MTTVAELYQQVLGREPDAAGLAYWTQRLGNNVDAAGEGAFISAAQSQLKSLPMAEQLKLAPNLVRSYYSGGDASGGVAGGASAPPTTYNSYLEQIKQTNPEAYKKIAGVAKYTADESFGGQVQDYQAQLLTSINPEKAGIPTKLQFSSQEPVRGTDPDTGLPITYIPPTQVLNAKVTPIEEGGFRSTTPTNINCVPVYAKYDSKGQVTGYEGDPAVTTWTSGQDRIIGNWDAQGNAKPIRTTNSDGNFNLKGIGLLAGLVGAAYGIPALTEAMGGSTLEATALGDMAATGAGGGTTAGGIGGLEGATAAQAAVDAATSTPVSSGSVNIRDLGTLDNPIVPSNTTGTPINAVNPATGAPVNVLGPTAAEVDAATKAAASVEESAMKGLAESKLGQSIPAAGLLGTAISGGAPAIAGSAAGTGISSLLTPGNALIAKGLLDTVGSNKVVSGINSAAATQQAAYEQSKKDLAGLYANQQGYQRPYMATGTNALSNLGALGTGTYQMYDEKGNPTGTGTGSGYLQHQFDATDLAKGLAPNYDFMLQQGQMANQRAANMAGGGFGGNALQGLNRYTQDYAGNAYQNAFTNYQNQRQNIFGNLSNLAGLGQGATKDLTAATGAYGTNLTNLNVGNAAAQAAAQVAAAQQSGTNLSNLGNTGVLATLLSQNPGIAKTPVNPLNDSGMVAAAGVPSNIYVPQPA